MGTFIDGVSNVWIVRVGMRGKGLDINGHASLDDAAFHLLCMDSWETDTKQRMLDFKARIDAHLQREADQEAFEAARESLIAKSPKVCPKCGGTELTQEVTEDFDEAICCNEDCGWFLPLREIYDATPGECAACDNKGWVFGRGMLHVPCACQAGIDWSNRPHPRDATPGERDVG